MKDIRKVYCPIYNREINGTECIVLCDVSDKMIKPDVLPDEITWKEDRETCKQCKYHD